jgi:dTDP-4-dehydrorhamnose 3,5-epimerase
MRIEATSIDVVSHIEIEPIEDDRGFFARSWCSREFAEAGLCDTFVQENVGFSRQAGTLRGLHFQREPFQEAKLARCTRGSVWDVAVDLRPDSPTRGSWVGFELTAERRNMLYVGEGCAHGYLTLQDSSELQYLTSNFFAPDSAAGVRYDDPALSIEWPAEIRTVSERDQSWPLLEGLDVKEPA